MSDANNSGKFSKLMSNSRVEMQILCMEPNDDHERFTRLLIEHEPELLRCVLVAVPNRADARDIMQECSVALWRRFSEYDPERSFVPWALGFCADGGATFSSQFAPACSVNRNGPLSCCFRMSSLTRRTSVCVSST